jgi:hypothetical protein
MFNTDYELDVRIENLTSRSRSSKYHRPIADLHLSKSTSVSLFKEATDRAIQLTDAPVALFAVAIEGKTQIAGISGLENLPQIAKNSDLAVELSGIEFCERATIDSDGSFFIDDCAKDTNLKQSDLYQVHGVRSYLGVPVQTSAGDNIGTIAILDFQPRQFSSREINSLQLISKWLGSEFDRHLLVQAQVKNWSVNAEYTRRISGVDDEVAAREHSQYHNPISPLVPEHLKLELLDYLSQELKTPLTSILGMSRVLQQEIYAPLSSKQKSYVDIILNSGLQLVSLVDEIANLGALDRQQDRLALKSVDVEMLCRSAIQSLDNLAQQKQQSIELVMSSPRRMWLLDKDKVKNILYYLMSSLIHSIAMVRSDLAHTHRTLTVCVYTGEDKLEIHIYSDDPQVVISNLPRLKDFPLLATPLQEIESSAETCNTQLRINCSLLLSQALAAIHGGRIEVNSDRSGYYLRLPLLISSTHH